MSAAVWQFEHSLAFLWDWNESGPLPALVRAVDISGPASLRTDRRMQHGAGAPVPWVRRWGGTYSQERGVFAGALKASGGDSELWLVDLAFVGQPLRAIQTIPKCVDTEVACETLLKDIVMHFFI